jgi:hypothetical protein
MVAHDFQAPSLCSCSPSGSSRRTSSVRGPSTTCTSASPPGGQDPRLRGQGRRYVDSRRGGRDRGRRRDQRRDRWRAGVARREPVRGWRLGLRPPRRRGDPPVPLRRRGPRRRGGGPLAERGGRRGPGRGGRRSSACRVTGSTGSPGGGSTSSRSSTGWKTVRGGNSGPLDWTGDPKERRSEESARPEVDQTRLDSGPLTRKKRTW